MKISKTKNINLNKIFDELFPICRSITGEGYLKSLKIINRYIKFKKIKYSSGKKIFDWRVPKIWNIKDAYIKYRGKKVVDFKKNNLHLVGYSVSVKKKMKLNNLDKYLHYDKTKPSLIHYVTSYYKKNWGFCISYNQRKKLKKNGLYDVTVKSNFNNGYLVNGLAQLKGSSKKVILLSSYLCHPSMANNELSGPLTLISIYNRIKTWKNKRYNYLFLINPETIGSLCFLSSHKNLLKKNLVSGLILTCLGGPKKKLTYKKSRIGNSNLDNIFNQLAKEKINEIRKFDPADGGSDERQYCSSELNLPVGQISRTAYGQYKEYHTSGDDKDFMKISQIEKSSEEIINALKINEYSYPLKRFIPYGELMLGKRNLYPNLHSHKTRNKFFKKNLDFKIMLNLLSYADGKHTILDIAKISKFKLDDLQRVMDFCIKRKLIIGQNLIKY